MTHSYQQILRSSFVIGGASVINVGLGLVRIKVAAVLLGPTGVGTIGLLQSLVATATSLAAMGIGTAGTRQIAKAATEAGGNVDGLNVAKNALACGAAALAVLGAVAFWLLRDVIALYVTSGKESGQSLGWLAIGVALSVIASAQTAVLTGLRELRSMAVISILSALIATVVGSTLLWIWGQDAVVLFVLTSPVAAVALGLSNTIRRRVLADQRSSWAAMAGEWRTTIRIGSAFMLGGLAATAGQLLVRALVQRQLGMEGVGQFQAATTISLTYLGFVLTAMGTDYYPRLTAVISDRPAANRMVNEQIEVALILAGPLLLVLLTLATPVIHILYSDAFGPAAAVLRWQVLGDILKVMSWPLGYIILAAGDGRTFVVCETLVVAVYAVAIFLGLPFFGLEAVGIGFVAMYVAYLFIVQIVAARRTGFRWQRRVAVHAVALFATAVGVFCVQRVWDAWGLWIGCGSIASFVFYGLGRLQQTVRTPGNSGGRLAALARRLFRRSTVG